MGINRGTIPIYIGIKLILFVLYLLGIVKPVLAGDPPTLLSPTNSSTVTSSKLQWQAPVYPLCSTHDSYRVQVDENSSFPSSSIYKDTYTSNTYYTPQLTSGTWYWRVMARDETCNKWSSWSSVWSFTLVEPTPTPTPASTPTPTPTSTPTHTPKPTSTATISPTNTPVSLSKPPSTTKPAVASDPPATSKPSSDKFDSPSFANARRIATSSYRIASVAGATAPAIPFAILEAKTNPIFWAGIIFIFAGVFLIGYIYLKKNVKIHL